MKKIFAVLLCVLLLVMPLSVSADESLYTEGENAGDKDYEVGDVFEGEVPGYEDTTEEETPTEQEIQPPVETPEETPTEPPVETPEEKPPVETPEEKPEETPPVETPPEENVNTISDAIVAWITPHLEEIGVIVALIGYGITLFTKFKTMNKSVSTLNNNAVTITEKNSKEIAAVRLSIEEVAKAVVGYEGRIATLLEKYETCAEEKAMLESRLASLENYLKVNADANIEFANELAELLGLSNIPNYKKEEIGAAHLKRVKAILEAKDKAIPTTTEEVMANVGEEA